MRYAVFTICVALCAAGCGRGNGAVDTVPLAILIAKGHDTPRSLPPATRVIKASDSSSSVARAAPRARRKTAFHDARTRFIRAKKLYLDLAFDASLRELDAARRAAANAAWDSPTFELLRKIALLHAQNNAATGDTAGRDEALRQAITLGPDATLSEALYAPDFRDAHAAVQRELAMRPPEAVSVTANVDTAAASLNGRAIGKTPLTARLHPSRYYLELRAFGYAPARRTINIDRQGTAPIRLDMEYLSRPELVALVRSMDATDLARLRDDQRLGLLKGLQIGAGEATSLNTEQLLHLSRQQNAWTGMVLDPNTGRVVGRKASQMTGAGDALQDVVRQMRSQERPDSGRKGVASKWWFWTALVGVAAAAGVTTYFLVRDQPETQLVFAN